ncbi:hypothetical protein POHY109586_23375 [Polaromonas hydrogenivorans]
MTALKRTIARPLLSVESVAMFLPRWPIEIFPGNSRASVKRRSASESSGFFSSEYIARSEVNNSKTSFAENFFFDPFKSRARWVTASGSASNRSVSGLAQRYWISSGVGKASTTLEGNLARASALPITPVSRPTADAKRALEENKPLSNALAYIIPCSHGERSARSLFSRSMSTKSSCSVVSSINASTGIPRSRQARWRRCPKTISYS